MTIPWRVAKSLLVLRDQLKAAHPAMSSPGFIGDDAHASRDSDHNPWVDDPASSLNVVTAGDVYHQPAKGMDAGKLAEQLRAARDSRVKYVIWDHRIFRAYDKVVDGKTVRAWQWAPYKGTNPHTGHCHISVSATKSLYDNTRPWNLGTLTPKDDDVISREQMQDLENRIDAAANAAARRWALWLARYELQTEDEKAAAKKAFDDAIKAGKTVTEAQAAMTAVLRPFDQLLKADQEKPT